MKVFFLSILLMILIAGCIKESTVKPKNNSSSTGATASTGTTTKTATDTTLKLSHDDSIHLAKYNINPQPVATSVSGTNLVLKFNENVDLLFTAEAYQKTSAVHLIENFTKSMLTGFDYTTVAEGGNTTLNWVDDNLNNVILKTVKDTVINKISMVKINVHRQFTFFKVYSSNQAALNEQTLFVNKKDDTISFSSYSYYNQKNYPTMSASAVLVYSK